jgi:FkbM family methyltransferase
MIKVGKIPDQKISLSRLNSLGFKPKVVFDVGAYKGEFADYCLEEWPEAILFAFEGLPDKIALLETKYSERVKVVPALVGKENIAEVEFFADETASSVLYSEEVYTKKKSVKQRMISLDSFIDLSGCLPPSLLKIDTQGFEFPIIQGCEKYIEEIEVLIIETNFLEVYHGSANASEVINYLYQRGFVIYDVCEIHRRPLDNALFQVDFMFVKIDSFLRANKLWDKAANR